MSCSSGGGCFSSGSVGTHSKVKTWEEMSEAERSVSRVVSIVFWLGLLIGGLVFLAEPGLFLDGGRATPQHHSGHVR